GGRGGRRGQGGRRGSADVNRVVGERETIVVASPLPEVGKVRALTALLKQYVGQCGVIHSRGGPSRQISGGAPGGGEARRETADVLLHQDLKNVPRQEEAPLRRRVRLPEPEQAAREDAGHVVVVLRQPAPALHDPDVALEVERRHRDDVHVGADTRLSELVGTIDLVRRRRATRGR